MNALERDFYEERRRKWRRSAFWRGFILASVIALVVVAITSSDDLFEDPEHIARFQVNGTIFDDLKRDELLAELARSDDARAVIVRINSPGGTTAGAEALYQSLRRIAETKPVVAVLGEVAASGGYAAAIGADHIVGRGNSLVGSIGVIMEYPNLTNVLDRLGIVVETVRSSELKAEPSPFRPVNEEARARDEAMVAESYIWFRDLVGERRDLSGVSLDEVANGGIFTGRLALANGLLDEIGGEPEAIDWLESALDGLDGLPVRDWRVEVDQPVLGQILSQMGASGGFLGEISLLHGSKLYSIAP